MITGETKLKIVELRSQGRSIASIAKDVGVAKQTVVDVCKDMKEEVAALNALRLDELYEAEKIGTEERIRYLSSLLAKLRGELEQRSLSDVPTDKLVDLILRTQDKLEEAKVEPVLKSTEEQKEEKEERGLLNSLT
jgi:orotate phosphoribosyltransferase-like protein